MHAGKGQGIMRPRNPLHPLFSPSTIPLKADTRIRALPLLPLSASLSTVHVTTLLLYTLSPTPSLAQLYRLSFALSSSFVLLLPALVRSPRIFPLSLSPASASLLPGLLALLLVAALAHTVIVKWVTELPSTVIILAYNIGKWRRGGRPWEGARGE